MSPISASPTKALSRPPSFILTTLRPALNFHCAILKQVTKTRMSI